MPRVAGARWTPAVALAALLAGSAVLRTRRFDVGFWIDEALSVGIADRPPGEIPGVLRQDGSPPLYYLLLHAWMRLLGDESEEATHALSLLLALLTVPVAFLLVRTLFGDRAGWIAAVMAAANPFLTQYAQETRMYSLVVLLGTIACCSFVATLALGRRWSLAFAASLAALLYTHNWALFFAAACGLAWLALIALAEDRRPLIRTGAIAFGGAVLLYLPWIPSLLFQAAHTGAPWARTPPLSQLTKVPVQLFGDVPVTALALAGAVALLGVRARPRAWPPEGRAIGALAVIGLGTMTLAWLASQLEPAWATRYMAIGLPPLLLLGALAVARAGRVGTVALLVSLGVWVATLGPEAKSNVRTIAEQVAPALAPGDLVISTQPEQAPALAYYLRDVPGLRWATLTGPLTDLGVTDWRDGVERLRAAEPERHLEPLLDRVPAGARVVLIEPLILDLTRWSAPWTELVRVKSTVWNAWMQSDGRFRVVAERPMTIASPQPNPVQATIFLRGSMR